jgi:type IV pilus assembly protein PilC
MPNFFYVARDKSGNKVTGTEESPNQDELVGRLQARNLVVINVASEIKEGDNKLKVESVIKGGFRHKHYRVTAEDLVLFCRQLSTLLGAGVTILKSLQIISRQVSSRKLQNIITNLQKNMEAGLSLHESMAKHPTVFSELWVNLVESGEASGNLSMILGRLAGYLERSASFKSKVISALIYPAILFIAGAGALTFLVVKIIPTFANLFSDFNMTLPLLTRLLIGVSVFVKKSLFLMIISTVIGVFLFKKYIKTKIGKRKYEKLKFNLPIFGEFFRVLVTERFTAEMTTLLQSGVPILYSLEISEHSVDNLNLADIIKNIKEDVRSGKSLSQPLEKSGFFEPMVVQMVTVGEEIGELPEMFKKINLFYQEYIETFLTRFTAIFEPVILIFMGVVIGLMVVGIFLPIFQIARIGGG